MPGQFPPGRFWHALRLRGAATGSSGPVVGIASYGTRHAPSYSSWRRHQWPVSFATEWRAVERLVHAVSSPRSSGGYRLPCRGPGHEHGGPARRTRRQGHRMELRAAVQRHPVPRRRRGPPDQISGDGILGRVQHPARRPRNHPARPRSPCASEVAPAARRSIRPARHRRSAPGPPLLPR